ncbi:hypothetical protein CB1_000319016 [Camelus ferus]|nr:hypothetical protein CB1_000319016 [Camelus ferus]
MARTLLPPCGCNGEVPPVMWIRGSVIFHKDRGAGFGVQAAPLGHSGDASSLWGRTQGCSPNSVEMDTRHTLHARRPNGAKPALGFWGHREPL